MTPVLELTASQWELLSIANRARGLDYWGTCDDVEKLASLRLIFMVREMFGWVRKWKTTNAGRIAYVAHCNAIEEMRQLVAQHDVRVKAGGFR
jgi:hypothetical protein